MAGNTALCRKQPQSIPLTPKILIIRPDPEGQNLAQWLREQIGIPDAVLTSPVMRIAAAGELPPLDDIKSLIFTSKHALRRFALLSPRRDLPCAVVGKASADLARDYGLNVLVTAPTAKELLKQLIASPPPAPCLYLRGRHISTDLVTPLSKVGIVTNETIIYQQVAEELNPQAQACLNREQPVILPLYSPRSAAVFYSERTKSIVAPLFVAAISETVQTYVVQSAELKVAAKPNDAAMRDLILWLWESANRLERGS